MKDWIVVKLVVSAIMARFLNDFAYDLHKFGCFRYNMFTNF